DRFQVSPGPPERNRRHAYARPVARVDELWPLGDGRAARNRGTMPREDSPLIVGAYWLDKRRDGKSPDIWQIATYSGKSRSVIYRSTKQRTVEDAAPILRAHEALERSRAHGQDPRTAELLPHLFNYIRERGPDIHRLDTIKSSFRAWIGFLMQDELGTQATVADITPGVAARFRRWRMGPHE